MTAIDATTVAAPVARTTRAALIVANPTAGGFKMARLDQLVGGLSRRGVKVEVRLTRHAGDLIEIARWLPSSTDTLVVCGGDGSINEAVQGLIARGRAMPALAVLPCGTANVLAHELALPFSPKALAKAIMARRTVSIHPGRAGARPFVLMASAGFDADVVHAVDRVTKRTWGKLAYAAAALRLAFAKTGRDVVVEADGAAHVCRLAVVTTARCYGGPLTITRQTDVTRPGLRLVMLANDRPATLAKAALFLALGRLDRLAAVTDLPVEQVRLLGAGIAMQVDGDAVEADEAVITTADVTVPVIIR